MQKRTEILIPEPEILQRISEMAAEIAPNYYEQKLLLVAVLKGAYVFAGELHRELYRKGLTDTEIDFMMVESYGNGTTSSRKPRIIQDIKTDAAGRNLLVVEDILDGGWTVQTVKHHLQAKGINSLKVATLLSKPSELKTDVVADYVGFQIANYWIQGFGIDTAEQDRGNPDIVQVHFDEVES